MEVEEKKLIRLPLVNYVLLWYKAKLYLQLYRTLPKFIFMGFFGFLFLSVIILVTGTIFACVRKITDKGIGNGISY